MKKRIWELDAARGLCILGMIAVHLLYDLTELYRLVSWQLPPAFSFLQSWGGVLVLLISGICATLGSRSIRRGSIVFSCGMLCTAVTAGMYFAGMADKGLIIYFGILHCLGICMLFWPVAKKWPTWLLAAAGSAVIAIGFWLDVNVRVGFSWLIPFGIIPRGFLTADYFPLLPYLGFFLLGAVLGRLLYRSRQSILPKVNSQSPILRFLQWTGRHSLLIYLLHQPVLTALFELMALL